MWIHLATVAVAVALTPISRLRPRGSRVHRLLGQVWAASLFATAAVGFLIRQSDPGRFSLIHILSAWMIELVPLIV